MKGLDRLVDIQEVKRLMLSFIVCVTFVFITRVLNLKFTEAAFIVTFISGSVYGTITTLMYRGKN